MLPDDSKPFHVICDASNFAVGSALMQFDDEGRERVVSFQSQQMILQRKIIRSRIIAYRRQKSSLIPAYGTVVVIFRRV
ncbi:unnamed protein product [Peronospora effusa]|nr:unnamed protein product [Peronospora effusa]